MRLVKQLDADDGVVWSSVPRLLSLEPEAAKLEIRRSRIRSRQSGSYLSPFRGRGMEFEEARPYQPGDDVRHIDWRVTARTNRPHSKVFREERERPVLLSVDCNASMHFGTRGSFKSVLAIELAALLAWRAKRQGDRVGGFVFDGERHVELKPSRSARSVLFLLHTLSEFSRRTLDENSAEKTNAEKTNLSSHKQADAVSRLIHVAKPGSLVTLISDFRNLSESFEPGIATLTRHCEVDLVQVYDPIEEYFPEAGRLQLSDGEQHLSIDTGSKKKLQKYHHQFVELQEFLSQLSRRYAAGYHRLSTQQGLSGYLDHLRIKSRGVR